MLKPISRKVILHSYLLLILIHKSPETLNLNFYYNKAMEPQRKRDFLPLNLAYNVVIIQVGKTSTSFLMYKTNNMPHNSNSSPFCLLHFY